MSRRIDAPSSRIIEGKRYILEKRNLLCEVNFANPKLFIDIFSKTQRLYCPQGKAFILETVYDLTGNIFETKKITRDEAMAYMDSHPYGIKEKVYIRYFGEPEEL